MSTSKQSQDNKSSRDGELTSIVDVSSRVSDIFLRYETLSQKPITIAHKLEANTIVRDFISVAAAYAKRNWVGEAMFNYRAACIFAESLASQDHLLISNAHLRHAKYLDENGWHSAALKRSDQVLEEMQIRSLADAEMNSWTENMSWLASIYIENKSFAKAEYVYREIFTHYSKKNKGQLDLTSAGYLENVARMQAYQRNTTEAAENYSLLMESSLLHEETVLCDLGFLSRQEGLYRIAKKFFERDLSRLDADSQE